jgi:phytoene dehydrogenase-like protein
MEENESEFIGDKVIGHLTSFGKLVAYDGSYHQAYPRAGVGAITECVLNSFPRGRAKIKTAEKVKKIEEGRKIETDKGEYSADSVVYSGYVKHLPEIVDDLPKEYIQSLKTLEQTRSITIWVGLDERLPFFDYKGTEIWFEEGKHFWAMATSNYNESFAPKNKQLVGFTSILEDDADKEKKRLMNSIETALPGIEKHIEFDHTQITVPEKAAITVGSSFPPQITPVKNLYLVGTDTDTRSMGVTRAAYSVVELLRYLDV